MTVNKNSVWLALIVILQLDCFFLVDGDKWHTRDVALILIAFFCIRTFTARNRGTGSVGYSYGYMVLAPILLAVISAVTAYMNYAQPFFLGFRVQRFWIASMCIYFPLRYLIKSGRYQAENLINTLDLVNAIYFAVVVLQYILGDSAIFLHAQWNYRYGHIRLYVSNPFMLISFMWHLVAALRRGRCTFRDLFFLCVQAFLVFFVTKSRMNMVALIAAVFLILLRQKLTVKKLLVLVIAFVAIIAFVFSPVGQDIYALVTGVGSTQDTSEIRRLSRQFYWLKLLSDWKNFVFGVGYPNQLWERAVEACGYASGFYVVDNGLMGQAFVYGLLGVIWMAWLQVKMIVQALRNKNDFALGYVVTGLLGFISLVPPCFAGNIAFPLVVALCESMMLRRPSEKKVTLEENNGEHINHSCTLE